MSPVAGTRKSKGILADRLAGRTPAGFWATLGPVNAEYEKRIPAT